MAGGQMLSSQSYSNDSLLVTQDLVVDSGQVLSFDRMVVMFEENKGIHVKPGGKIIADNSVFRSACYNTQWKGIKVEGNSLASNCLTITNSYFKQADTVLKLSKVKDFSVVNSTFIGRNQGIAIKLNEEQDFLVSRNTIYGFSSGIQSENSPGAVNGSRIEKNIFASVGTGIKITKGNHQKLDINCNRFQYADYAIKSDSTVLKNQGTQNVGAGNKFISNSNLPYHKLKHANGNNLTYYFNAADSVGQDMNVNLSVAQNQSSCFGDSVQAKSASTSIEKVLSEINFLLEVIPNPSSGEALVKFRLGTEQKGFIYLHDLQGREIDRHKIDQENGELKVNYTQLSAGLYMITLVTESGLNLNKKLVLTK